MDILTELKKNIISWYPIDEEKKVLQIGEDEQIEKELKSKSKKVTVINEKSWKSISGQYDFVVLIGICEKITSGEEIRKLLEYLKGVLSNDGKILLAMQNKFGMKYWAGENVNGNVYETIISSQENIFSFSKVKKLLNSLNLRYKFYYPLTDYNMTNVIYTDEFMPDNDSIDSRVLTFCNEDNTLNFSEKEAYKQIIEEEKGLFPFFSNSYFIEIAKNDNFQDIKYVSYSINRKPEYRIQTVIHSKEVYKTAVGQVAEKHIQKISNNIEILNKCQIKSLDRFEQGKVISKYLDNVKSLDVILMELYNKNGIHGFLEKVKEYKQKVLDKLWIGQTNLEHTAFEKYNITMPRDLKQKLHFTVNGVYDLIFQNCFVKDNEYYVYDQEWYEENIPIEFILYRAVLYLTEIKEKDEIYRNLNLSEFISYFEQLDNHLQKDIKDEEIWKAYIDSLNEIEAKLSFLKNYKERVTLTNNHVTNLESIVKNLENNIKNDKITIENQEKNIIEQQKTIENQEKNIQEQQKIIETQQKDIKEQQGNFDKQQEILKETQNIIANNEKIIEENEKKIEEYSIGIQGLRQGIDNLTNLIHQKDEELVNYADNLRIISNSFSWKITKPIRILSWLLNPTSGASFIDRIMPPGGRRRIEYDRKQTEKKYAKKVQGYFNSTDEETAEFWKGIDHRKNLKYQKDLEKQAQNQLNDYEKWIMANKLTDVDLEKQQKTRFWRKPKISILVPLYKTKKEFFQELLYTLHCQTYSNWELCLADGSPEPLEEIQKMCEKDKRIKYKFIGKNGGISENTNEALSLATGKYIALLDHDDFLEENCLYEIVKCINKNPKVQFIYTDEDKASGLLDDRYDAYFKSDFAPDTLRSQNYICHFSVFKKEIMDKLGGFRKDYDGAQDYDIFLRMSEIVKPENIKHIPKILYHWRIHKESTAMEGAAKPWAFDAGRKAVESHIERMNLKGVVRNGKALGTYEVEYEVEGNPKVSIIIPNKDGIDVLKVCINSILNKTTYDNYEIVIVENNSTEKKTFEYYKELKKNPKIKIVYYKEKGFNYSKIINFGVKNADGDFIMQLNNDTELITPNWLEKMVGYCQRKEIGAVGVKLLFQDETVQHAGVLLGLGGIAGHLHRAIGRNDYGYFSKAVTIQNMTAVTAACIMTRREIYEEVGYMNEELAVAFNDIDFCLKIRKAGYLIIYNPYIELWHYESKTRGMEDTPEKVKRFNNEIDIFKKYWSKELEEGDPYYNKNLRLDNDQYEVRTEKVE